MTEDKSEIPGHFQVLLTGMHANSCIQQSLSELKFRFIWAISSDVSQPWAQVDVKEEAGVSGVPNELQQHCNLTADRLYIAHICLPLTFMLNSSLLQALNSMFSSITQSLSGQSDELINEGMISEYRSPYSNGWARRVVKPDVTRHRFAQRIITADQASKTQSCRSKVLHVAFSLYHCVLCHSISHLAHTIHGVEIVRIDDVCRINRQKRPEVKCICFAGRIHR